MATLDWRSMRNAHKGGSDDLIFGLTADQNQRFTGDATATATWIAMSYLLDTGGTIGRDRDSETLYSEGGERADAVSRDEFTVTGAVLQTDKRVLDLLDFLEDEEVVCKRLLPLKTVGPTGETHQLWGSERSKIDRENWRMATGRTDARTRPFTARWLKDDPSDATVKPYDLFELDVAAEAGWPPAAAPYKETAFGV